ncbi:hypothetical protein [Glycomyces arizonensis]|uniref:hypothetical protein n=1 Tax=Glycomyces arizonensis TaxID=256035 RepID=UPI0003FFFA8D|nr:hypothetical protein [Glycomyces arizonensis]
MANIAPAHREQLKAFATGDLDRAQALSDAMSDHEWAGYRLLHAALFSVLLDNHFQHAPGGISPQTIAELVTRIRRDYEAANITFDSWTVEGVLRATAGEEYLFERFSNEDIISTQTIVVGRLTSYDLDASKDIDAFLDAAEALVTAWERQSQ